MTGVALDAGAQGAASSRHFQRSASFLVANTLATGALGTLFWLVAARFYPEREVGTAVAASSLLLALAFVAQLNMSAGLSRFLPGAGPAQRLMVLFAYGTAMAGATVLGLLVLAVTGLRGGELVRDADVLVGITIAAALPLWVVFALQDNALVAVRRSGIVPLENVLVSLAKFALLPVLVGLGAGTGLLLAWVLPILVAIPLVNLLLFRRLPDHRGVTLVGRGRFVTYALKDMPGQISILLAMRLVPAIVVEHGGGAQGAFIGVPWSIVTVASLALPTLSLALLSELSRSDTDAAALSRHAIRLVILVILPAVVIGALLARPVLSIADAQYADRGASVLAWGLVGLAPAAFFEVRLAGLRAVNRLGLAGGLQVARSVALLGVVTTFVLRDHAERIGVAFLGVNLVAALLIAGIPPTRARTRS